MTLCELFERELRLEFLDRPCVEDGVAETEGPIWRSLATERGGIWVCVEPPVGPKALEAVSLLTSFLSLCGGSELFKKSKSKSSFTSGFLGRTKLDDTLLLEPKGIALETLAVPAKTVALGFFMFPAAAEMKAEFPRDEAEMESLCC